MSKERMIEAKSLIQQKRYAEARQILEQFDNDTARKWLIQIDKLSPVSSKPTSKTGNYTPAIVSSIIVGLIALIIGFIGGYGVGSNQVQSVSFPPTLMIESNEVATDTPQDSPVSDCDPEAWYRTARPIVVEFLDNGEIMTSTPRGQLAPLVTDLRATVREFEALPHPDCMSELRSNLYFGMSNAVDGFTDFLGSNDIGASVSFSMANQRFADAHDILEELLFDTDLFSLKEIYMSNTGLFIWGGDDPEQYVPAPTFTPSP